MQQVTVSVNDGMYRTLFSEQLDATPGQGPVYRTILGTNNIGHGSVIEIKRVTEHLLAEFPVDMFHSLFADQFRHPVIDTGMHKNKRAFTVTQLHTFIKPREFTFLMQEQVLPLPCRCIHHAQGQARLFTIRFKTLDLFT